ncbi:MAG: DUF1963 domain-containing protein, partial [Cyanobacteria bacterium J06614_10]
MKPAVYIRLEQAGKGDIGQSRIGGTPDLPSGISWPKSSYSGHYLCFILQINL